ncbi:Hypothetical protein SMAX5B_004748 [Scophthalmus maximus]|uniref:Uncharacterized protein n=1 Tax=Scophthalmus maximus TaxID=52904 RepID=A0A2U9B6M3_SCOMX|nr:Hypothetical protein SMAX5B_004748 [Scophthalmus maximus]
MQPDSSHDGVVHPGVPRHLHRAAMDRILQAFGARVVGGRESLNILRCRLMLMLRQRESFLSSVKTSRGPSDSDRLRRRTVAWGPCEEVGCRRRLCEAVY